MSQRTEKTSRTVRRRTVLVAIAVGAAAVTSVTVALASGSSKTIQSKQNDFYPAVIENAVKENDSSAADTNSMTWSKGTDSYSVDKKVNIVNVDTTDTNANAYVRVCIVPRWICTMTDSANTQVDVTNTSDIMQVGSLTAIRVTGNTYTMGDVTFTLADDWANNWFFNPIDGYFYCNHIVKVGGETETLLESVSIGAETLEKINKENSNINLEVDVISDSIQTVGGAVEARWTNVTISNKKLLTATTTTTTTTTTTVTEEKSPDGSEESGKESSDDTAD
jgi:hypothetical protein